MQTQSWLSAMTIDMKEESSHVLVDLYKTHCIYMLDPLSFVHSTHVVGVVNIGLAFKADKIARRKNLKFPMTTHSYKPRLESSTQWFSAPPRPSSPKQAFPASTWPPG